MPAKQRIRPLCTFTLDQDLVDGLKKLKERVGVSESETVRRALRKWLVREGVVKSEAPGARKAGRQASASKKR